MRNLTLPKVLPWLLIIFGSLGLAASAAITIEKISLLQHPSEHLICDINPVISCGSVMSSPQADLFGFTNSLIGLAAFPVLITTGVILLSGVKLRRWYWLGLQLGAAGGLVFVHWLFYQTVYRIGTLCPYCMVVWVSVITIFWYSLLYNLGEATLKPPRRLIGWTDWLRKHHFDILIIWLLILFGLILKHFWYYYGSRL